MSELNKAMAQLKNAAQELMQEIAIIDAEINKLASKRDSLTSAGVSRDDFLSYLRDHIQKKAARFKSQILPTLNQNKDFGSLERGLTTGNSFIGFDLFNQSRTPETITEGAAYFYFEDLVISRLSDELKGADWPINPIAVSTRRTLLEEIKNETIEWEAKRNDLISSLQKAGITSK